METTKTTPAEGRLKFTKEKDSCGRYIIWKGERLVAVVYSGEADADLIVRASYAIP